MPSIYQRYVSLLKRYPLPVKIASSIVIFGSGDIGMQTAEVCVDSDKVRSYTASFFATTTTPKKPAFTELFRAPPADFNFDLYRTSKLSLFGVIGSTFLHFWYGVQEKIVFRFFPVENFAHVVFKVFLDQGLPATTYTAFFFVIQGATAAYEKNPDHPHLKNVMAEGAHHQVTNYLIPQMTDYHWKFWPFFHLWNFSRNSLHERIIFQNLASIGWSAFLSSVNEENKRKERALIE
eukprot:CAMPEP_0182472112 /NCGR_PEP_ID=MMETSP1319-20130603/21563_1 /TAXON_ID=172717 /ORGANISM="Bolidomonas pacifica, Strain RCC208" /LENGTH=234 /DNA_ID=CAMNT_0024672749 /DNA_START=86 /DNA_END=787 /DNA_ORIENTATION=+